MVKLGKNMVHFSKKKKKKKGGKGGRKEKWKEKKKETLTKCKNFKLNCKISEMTYYWMGLVAGEKISRSKACQKLYKLSNLGLLLVTQVFIISRFFLLTIYPFSFLLSAGDFGLYSVVSVCSYLPLKSVEVYFGRHLNYLKVAHFSLVKTGFWA